MTTALIADDEPVLRRILETRLAKVWPELRIVARARNGREAVELFDRLRPDVCFLDVHMPGMTGVEAARHIGQKARLVFVTAFDRYAVEAFEQGVLDYLVKPVTEARLAATVDRLRAQIEAPQKLTDDVLQQLARRLAGSSEPATSPYLRWLRAAKSGGLLLIPVSDVDFMRADCKYTVVGYRDDTGRPTEALIRLPLKDLVSQLDPGSFAQVHRGVVVNLNAVRRVMRIDRDTAEIELKHRPERLPVSRTYLPLFKEM